MKLVETAISSTAIRMRYANDADATKASEWIDFRVSLADLVLPADPNRKLGDLESHYLATIHQAALRHARDIIGDETQRLASLPGRRT